MALSGSDHHPYPLLNDSVPQRLWTTIGLLITAESLQGSRPHHYSISA